MPICVIGVICPLRVPAGRDRSAPLVCVIQGTGNSGNTERADRTDVTDTKQHDASIWSSCYCLSVWSVHSVTSVFQQVATAHYNEYK